MSWCIAALLRSTNATINQQHHCMQSLCFKAQLCAIYVQGVKGTAKAALCATHGVRGKAKA
jgi:hypothetical protein